MHADSPVPVPTPTAVALDLTGRSALVTGAASGIGRACAARLAAAGARVHLVDVDPDALAVAAAAVGGTAHVADLTDEAALAGLPAEVDVLVNNAGTQHVAPIEDFPPEVFRSMHALMVLAPFLLLRRVLPHMYARGWGRVVNISSVHGLRASPYKSAYVSAKHALEGLSKVTAVEAAPHGVTSACVCPGYVRTPLVSRQIAAQAAAHGLPEEEVTERVLLDRPALKRLIEPEEVAEAVAWLCTPQASYLTGSSLCLDGAWTAT
ncbi:3-hydroxybutyrate dehydrogenase [Marinitenerispora sediminis]|uniref:3-hydroxybutyrate dehydrogenase n=1 Tax=Marinitenerispora sediminis TaxID=1931232 RepID=A0A368SYS6_9ACTN|nr:3-hydroxybutyrate dehydrogenase [Marinitenerispora sediminis]RCV47721.1 3-hydroxybutyrate dehydrogenase [Marinitenerispora sediminis]RCV48268.1 3-hydroxybutyrate dehydrogenase [Marinitenerispora sediminis]RCV49913.1 3-hydroxybutyrate dehydrogenase [Marinitenerispora sediminis]